ncbi:uncharacterized protein [Nicotiana tomentosiformis]|uniref:uncharacterized protein n=1 Tax=Nicotiana tomentosiformis TaxID=4098 RepID=UPI00388CD625
MDNWNETSNWLTYIRDHNFILKINGIISWKEIFSFAIWTIWVNRNNNLFNNTTIKAVVQYAHKQTVEYKLLTDKEAMPPQKIPISVKWVKPPCNHIKLNINQSFKEGTSLCGFGGLFRDNRGQWVLGFQGSLPGLSPLHAELMALKTGLRLAMEQGFTDLEVESDSTDAISCLENGNATLNNTIHECRLLMIQVKVQTIQHNFREANKPAHKLARNVVRVNNGRDLDIMHYRPPFLTVALSSNYEGSIYLVKNISSDVCTKLASFGNNNVLCDISISCNSQVGNVPLGTANFVNSIS